MKIFFDYASTTPIMKEVAELMYKHMLSSDEYANPSSTHWHGQIASKLINKSRETLKSVFNSNQGDFYFTSGATESNNIAIQGLASSYVNLKGHIITTSIEHKSILNVCQNLQRKGIKVSYVKPDKNGIIQLSEIIKEINDETFLVSIGHINNEIGSIQNIMELSDLCKKKDLFFHVDAAQSAGKLNLNLSNLTVDLLSISSHKFYGPKGVGALYVSDRAMKKIHPLFYGGEQENRLRPGTLATHQIIGMAKALEICTQKYSSSITYIRKLQEQFFSEIKSLKAVKLNGDSELSYPGIVNISVLGVKNTDLMKLLSQFSFSLGSACNSSSRAPSHVLKSLRLNDEEITSSIRLSFGIYTTSNEISLFTSSLKDAVKKLRLQSPSWRIMQL